MKKLLLLFLIIGTMSCSSPTVLENYEYAVIDTLYTSKNAFGEVLNRDVLVLTKPDSVLRYGTLSARGRLVYLNARPIKHVKYVK